MLTLMITTVRYRTEFWRPPEELYESYDYII